MAQSLLQRMQEKAASDLKFGGYYEVEEGSRNVVVPVTTEMKKAAADGFEDYVKAVDFVAGLIVNSNSASKENIERARKNAFELGLDGEAKIFFGSLEGRVKRDYPLLLATFERRYRDGMDPLEEREQRKAILERFRKASSQGSRSLAAYFAEGIFLYDLLADKYKMEQDQGELELEDKFLDGMADPVLIDSVRSSLQQRGKEENFTVSDIMEIVKFLRKRQWNTEEYQRVFQQLKDRELGLEAKIAKKADNGVKELVEVVGRLIDKVGTSAPSSTSTTSQSSYVPSAQPRTTHQSSWPPRGMKNNVTCYSCGQEGHVSRGCPNPPLKREEQLRVMEKDRLNRESRMVSMPVSQVEALTLDDRMLNSERALIPVREDDGLRIFDANSVEVYQVGIGAKDSSKVDMVEVTMAEKRKVRGENASTGISEERPRFMPKQTKKPRPVTAETIVDEMDWRGTGGSLGDGKQKEMEQVEKLRSELMRRERLLKPSNVPVLESAGRKDKPKRSVTRLLGDQSQLDIAELMRNTSFTLPGGFSLSLAQILDSNPYLRSQLAWYCQRLVSQKRKGKKVVDEDRVEVSAVSAIDVVLGHNQRSGKDRVAHPEPAGTFEMIANFYTSGVLRLKGNRMVEVARVMLDGGSMINLINKKLVRKYSIQCTPVQGLMMRTATDEVVLILFQCQVQLKVGHVWSAFTCFVNPKNSSYGILLSRRWLYQMRAVGDYGPAQGYFIRCRDGLLCEVPRDRTSEDVPLKEVREMSVFRTEGFQSEDEEFVKDLEREEDKMAKDMVERWSIDVAMGSSEGSVSGNEYEEGSEVSENEQVMREWLKSELAQQDEVDEEEEGEVSAEESDEEEWWNGMLGEGRGVQHGSGKD